MENNRNNKLMQVLQTRKSHRLVKPKLSPTNRKVIEEAINTLPDGQKNDLFVITSAVGDVLARRYGTKDRKTGEYYLTEGSEYQLERTGMANTYDIAEKIDIYLEAQAESQW